MIKEIPMAFQIPRIQDVATWYAWIDGLRLTALAELDSKEQSNRVKPQWIFEHMETGSEWLYAKKKTVEKY